MRILTLNLWYIRKWELKGIPLISKLKELNPDIFCAQELTGRRIKGTYEYLYEGIEIEKDLKYQGFYSTGLIHAPNQGIYVKPKDFEVLDSHEISFSGILETGEIDKHRRLLLAQLVKVEGKELLIVNLHLSVKKEFRHQNWKEFLIWLKSMGYEDKNILVVGDLNTYDEEDVHLKVLSSGFKNAWSTVRDDECITYYSSEWWVKNQPEDGISKSIIERDSHWDDNCLDYVFYRGDIDIKSAEYLDLVPEYTDHKGVVVDFEIK
jgi:endonuclease/exonuclease/phosphatase family metal-dependent hydrolase